MLRQTNDTSAIHQTNSSAENCAVMFEQTDRPIAARKVLVFPGENEAPVTRLEIDVHDSNSVDVTAEVLAQRLREEGLTVRTSYEPWIPSQEIWLTLPRAAGRDALISLHSDRALPHTVTRQVNPAVLLP